MRDHTLSEQLDNYAITRHVADEMRKSDKVLLDEIAKLRNGLQDLIHGYVVLLESARDRIVSLGGQCDDVYTMEMGDHYLRTAKKILEETK